MPVSPIRNVAFAGSARIGSEVAAPALAADTTRQLRDYEAEASWQSERIGLDVTYSRTSAYTPFAPAEFAEIPAIGTVPRTDWITVAARLAPLRWLTLESWYSDPRTSAGIEGIPPSHSLTRGTIRSKFLRTLVQFQIGTFSFFWDRGNLTATNRTYVPGFRLPSYATTFGVRWGFLN